MVKQDRFVSWVEITTDNNAVVIDRPSQASILFTLEPGIYYMYADPLEDRPDTNEFIPFFTELEAALVSKIGGTWSIQARDQVGSILKNRAISITSSIQEWSFDTINTTLPLSFLGLDTTTASTTTTNGVMEAPFSYSSCWMPYSLVSMRIDKRSYIEKQNRYSDQDTRRAYALRIRQGVRRTFEYSYVPPQVVFAARNDDSDYQVHSFFVDGDRGNSLDSLWSTFDTSNDVVGLRPLLCVHDEGDADLEVWSNQHEVLIPYDVESISTFRNNVSSLMNVGGEYYRILMDFWSVGGNYEY